MTPFDSAYSRTSRNEGGYVNDPTDRGGETYNGIARKKHPKWEGWKVIDAAKKVGRDLSHLPELDEAERNFYRREFWARMGLDLIKSVVVTDEVYDSGVNCGARTATRWLQEAYNLCNQNGKIGPDLKVDGLIGPKTAQQINRFPIARAEVLLKVLNLLQGDHYLNICRKDRSQERFLHGWVLQRINL